MYPTLYEAFKDLFGWDLPFLKIIMTFGFFVALAFIAANWAMIAEFKRKEEDGELQAKEVPAKKTGGSWEYISNALLGFVLGWKLVYMVFNFSDISDDPQSFLLSGEGSIIWGLVLAIAFTAYKWYLNKNQDRQENPGPITVHPYQLMGNITLLAAGAGFLGAKIFHHLEYWDDFMADPVGALTEPFSGLTFFGGLIFGGIAVLWYANKYGIKWHQMLDVGAPAMMLSYGIGRMGCHFSGDGDWGVENLNPKPESLSWLPDWAWAYDYPNNVLGVTLENPVWPTPLYEIVMALALFVVLWSIRKKVKASGVLFSIYMIFSGVERFFIEKIRVNSKYQLAGIEFTQAEMISLIFVLLGIAGIVYFSKKAKN